jgi:hypothetical protein
MQKNRAPNHLEGAQLVNLPNFEEVLQKKAEVYTKKIQVRRGQTPGGPPCIRHCLRSSSIDFFFELKTKKNELNIQILVQTFFVVTLKISMLY